MRGHPARGRRSHLGARQRVSIDAPCLRGAPRSARHGGVPAVARRPDEPARRRTVGDAARVGNTARPHPDRRHSPRGWSRTMIKPVELESPDGNDIWATLSAAAAGDVPALRRLLDRNPRLSRAEYWYTPAL